MNRFLGEEGTTVETAIAAYKFLISGRKVLQTPAYFRCLLTYSMEQSPS